MQACVLIISFALLGLGLTNAFSTFFMVQKQGILIEQSKKISKVFKQGYFLKDGYSISSLEKEIEILEQYLDASFIFTDSDDRVKIVSKSIDAKWYNKKLDIAKNIKIKKDKNGVYYQMQGTMNGIFEEPVLSIGYPLIINENYLGTIFINMPLTEILMTVESAYKIIILFTILAVMIAFILVYFFSKKISLPLIEINKAAKVMASGDFRNKIQVDSKDEIGQLAEVLNNMAENLDEQEKRRREFISNISHDIRSPLTSMKGFLQAIIDGTIEEDKKEKYLNIVLEETERLTRLANNILDINQLETIEKEKCYSKFDINELIRNIIRSFEARAIEKNLEINVTFCEEEMFVFTDIEKVQRIIYNLIDNAIKFTEDNKKVYVSVNNKGGKAYISIKDEGIGISLQEQKRVFDRFYKSDYSRGKDKKGSGLGLSIVKEFILSLGEAIEINSELNKGSEFIFTLTKG